MKNYRSGRITIQDRTAVAPQAIVLTFDGNFNVDVPGVDITWALDRGELPDDPEPIKGDEKPITFSLEAKIVNNLTDDEALTLGDLLFAEHGAGYAAGWVSALDDVLTMDVVFDDDNGTGHGFTLPDSVARGKYSNGNDGNMISLTGVCPHPYPTLH